MWKKLNFLYCPSGEKSWSLTHATVPTPFYLGHDEYRVFFSTRDSSLRNRVGFIDIVIKDKDEIKVLRESSRPVIDLGDLGCFDCDGIYATSLVKNGDDLFFYYAGWNAGLRGLFYSNIGLAISKDCGNSLY